ncbi:hypothetical protein TKK_0011351 [Trichogramma kaykai]
MAITSFTTTDPRWWWCCSIVSNCFRIKILEVSDLKYDNAPEFLIFDLTFKTTNILLAVVYMRSHCTQIRRITKSDISNNNYLTR